MQYKGVKEDIKMPRKINYDILGSIMYFNYNSSYVMENCHNCPKRTIGPKNKKSWGHKGLEMKWVNITHRKFKGT